MLKMNVMRELMNEHRKRLLANLRQRVKTLKTAAKISSILFCCLNCQSTINIAPRLSMT